MVWDDSPCVAVLIDLLMIQIELVDIYPKQNFVQVSDLFWTRDDHPSFFKMDIEKGNILGYNANVVIVVGVLVSIVCRPPNLRVGNNDQIYLTDINSFQ